MFRSLLNKVSFSGLFGGRQSKTSAQRSGFRPELERLEARDVPSLTPVGASAGYPYTAIVELQATYPDGKTFVGSGVMVDSFHVLTAGHVVYDASQGGWVSQIKAIPELNGTYQPFGSASMTYERTYNAWVNYDKANPNSTIPGDYDIGLITLNRTLGNQTGWMSYGYDNNNADFSSGRIFNTAGYPAVSGYNGRQMEFSSGAIAGLSSNGLAIDYYQSSITTYGGQSGSPVWEYFPGTNTRVVYGIHVGGTGTANSLNFATRITQSIFTDLGNWRSADRAPTTSLASKISSIGSNLNVSGLVRFGLQSAEWTDGNMALATAADAGGPVHELGSLVLGASINAGVSTGMNPALLARVSTTPAAQTGVNAGLTLVVSTGQESRPTQSAPVVVVNKPASTEVQASPTVEGWNGASLGRNFSSVPETLLPRHEREDSVWQSLLLGW